MQNFWTLPIIAFQSSKNERNFVFEKVELLLIVNITEPPYPNQGPGNRPVPVPLSPSRVLKFTGSCDPTPSFLVENVIQPQIAELSTHQLKIKSSSKLDFSKVVDVAVFLSANS